MKAQNTSLFQRDLVREALAQSIVKLNPRIMFRNPVMFTVWIGTLIMLIVTIVEVAEKNKITTICIGKPHLNLFKVILATNVFNGLLNKMSSSDIDLVIFS